MSVTVLRAESGSAAPRQVSALTTIVPPPSMRQPPELVSAVLRLLVLARISVPAPSFHSVLVPAMVEPMVAVTLESTMKLDGTPLMERMPELIEYPVVLNVRLLTDTVKTTGYSINSGTLSM